MSHDPKGIGRTCMPFVFIHFLPDKERKGGKERRREGGEGRTGGVDVTMLIHRICSVARG